MREYVFVKPNPGGRVRMPDRDNTVMPETGQLVPRIDYYERLIITGDLTVCDPPKADKPVEPEAQEERPAPPPDTSRRR